MFVLASSNFKRGECVRTLKVNKTELVQDANLIGNKQVLRTSLYNDKVCIKISMHSESCLKQVFKNFNSINHMLIK